MKFSIIDGLPFENPAWIAGVDREESNSNDNESYSDESGSNTETDAESYYKSEPDDQPDAEDEIGDFEPKPVKPETINKEPNPTMVIDQNVEATIDEATPNAETPVKLRRSTRDA